MSIIQRIFATNQIKIQILKIKRDIKRTVKPQITEKFFIDWYGAYDVDPKHLVFWVCVKTDKQKKDLERDTELNTELRHLLIKNNYPESARNHVQIGFESQETVDRESNGNWYHHFK